MTSFSGIRPGDGLVGGNTFGSGSLKKSHLMVPTNNSTNSRLMASETGRKNHVSATTSPTTDSRSSATNTTNNGTTTAAMPVIKVTPAPLSSSNANLETPATNTTTSLPKAYGKIVLTLENVLLPIEKLSPTPSSLDGLEEESEIDLRIMGCELITTAGILLKLPQVRYKKLL